MRHWGMMPAALLIAAVLAVIGTTPPGPVGADAPATAFSAERAMADVRLVAARPHPVGSAENAAVRGRLLARMRALRLEVRTATTPLSARGVAALKRQGGAWDRPQTVTNLLGTIPGRDRRLPVLLLMAHHDSVVGSPGAPDDAAGVAALLEVARAIRAGGAPRRDVVLLLTDGEELGLEGAAAFFARDPLAGRVGTVVNVEARGGGGRTTLFETGAANGDAVRLFARAVERPVGTSLSVFVYRRLPNSTDMTRALERGLPGFNFAFVGRPGLYHSPLATPDALDRGSLQDMGRQALGLTRALGDAAVLPGRAPDRTFFDLFGLVFLHYPPAWGWLPLGAAAGLIGWAAWGRGGPRDLGRGGAAAVAAVGGAVVLLWFGNLVSGADGPLNYYDRLAAIPLLQVQALLLCSAATAGAAALIARASPMGWAGAALPALLAGVAAQILAPTTSFPFAVALLAVGIAAAARSRLSGTAGGAIAAVAGGVGLGHLLALGFFLLQGVGGSSQRGAAAPLLLALPILAVLAPAMPRGAALRAAAALVLAGLAMALWVRLDPIAPTVATYSAHR